MTSQRRFPPPWRVVDNGSAYFLEDAAGHSFAYCYYREHAVVGTGSWHLSPDEARRLVTNFAKLPQLLESAATISREPKL